MSAIGDRLRAARVRSGMSQQEIADKIGVSTRTYIRYEGGETEPTVQAISVIAELCGVDSAWLATGDGTTGATSGSPMVRLPRLDVILSAGSGTAVYGEDIIEHITLPVEYLRDVLHVPADQASIVSIFGDSMYDTLSEGDLVIVDHSVKTFRQDAVYVLRIADRLLVKRLRIRLDGTLVVASDNPRYPEELIPPGRLDQVAIVGRVAGRLGRLNGSRIP